MQGAPHVEVPQELREPPPQELQRATPRVGRGPGDKQDVLSPGLGLSWAGRRARLGVPRPFQRPIPPLPGTPPHPPTPSPTFTGPCSFGTPVPPPVSPSSVCKPESVSYEAFHYGDERGDFRELVPDGPPCGLSVTVYSQLTETFTLKREISVRNAPG